LAVLVVVAAIAPRFRQLNCKCSYTTGAWMNTFALSSGSLVDPLARRSSRPADGSRFFHGEFFGLIRHGIFLYRNEFRENTNPIFTGRA
jgi:hypothetical protein